MSKCNSPERAVTVYSLHSSVDGAVRYIGQTTQPLRRRLMAHLNRAKHVQDRHLCCWIRRQVQDGHTIEIAAVIANAVWDTDETRIIAQYRASGHRLVNATTGGQGTYGAAHPRGGKGKKKPEGFGARVSAARKGIPGTPWTEHQKALQSQLRKGVPLTTEHALKIAAALTGKAKSESHRRALGAQRQGQALILSPEQEARRIVNAAASSSRADVRAKRSASMKNTLARKRAAQQGSYAAPALVA